MGWFGASADELRDLGKVCKPSIAAFKACLKANALDKRACTNLESSALSCLSQQACLSQHKSFIQCIAKSHAEGTQEGRIRRYTEHSPCKKHSDAMRRCLRWKGIWPKVVDNVEPLRLNR